MENLFFTIFDGLPRQGPGDNASTRKAFYSLPAFSQQANILDIGCGTGIQTLELARLSPCQILALDNHEPYLRDLKIRAREENLDKKISTILGDMHNLPFSEAEFDLIWSEGSIYIIGFEKGLREWRKYLKPGGSLVVTELIWTSLNPPDKAREFWEIEYPAMQSDPFCKNAISRSGFTLIRDFLLPKEAWWEQYYQPLSKRVVQMKKNYAASEPMIELLHDVETEIKIYTEFNSHFGYAFYIMKKSD
ncbi:MAG: class I SAM-dependent methyltransferase [Cyclobacteriaceae bacterium]|nr:class I SAM-dependent methyltransferase [Cyclobacteriaceae bacterium]